jgi:hypothetical protein
MTRIRRMKKGDKVYLCEYKSVREGPQAEAIGMKGLFNQERRPIE